MINYGVSIAICCYNSASRLEPTLAHLAAQQGVAGIPWEVIVVDNASSDDTAEAALRYWPANAPAPLRVVHEPQPGLSHARRRGFSEAQYEYVSFIDDDNWVAPNWVMTVKEVMDAHPEAGACGGRSEAVFESDPPEWFDRFVGMVAVGEQAKEEGDVTESRGWLWGAGLNIRKSAWSQIQTHGWKSLLSDRKGSNLTSGGDNEICYWLRFLGWRLYYSPRLSLKHFMPSGRLNWDYLSRMVQVNGYTAMIDGLYRKELRRISSPKMPQKSAFRLWLSALRNFYTYLNEPESSKRMNTENIGCPDFLNQIRSRAILNALLRTGPFRYRKIIQSIRKMRLTCSS